jgi:hypothetical protein
LLRCCLFLEGCAILIATHFIVKGKKQPMFLV